MVIVGYPPSTDPEYERTELSEKVDLKDDSETAYKLFSLLNLIVEYMITKPKEIKGLYEKLPEKTLEGINQRDSKS